MSEALLGVVLGGLIGTISGTITTFVQLRGSATAKERERRLSLKKEIILEAALALDKPLAVLANVLRFDLPKEQVVAPLQEGPGGWLNKLTLVAGTSTQRAVTEALGCALDCLVELILKRVDVERIDVELQIVRARISDYLQAQREATEFIKGLGRSTEPGYLALGTQWSNVEQELQQARLSEAQYLERRLRLQIALYSQTLELRTTYMQRVGEALVEMRKEIDLSTDVEEWGRIAEESQRRGEAALRKLLAGLSASPTTSSDVSGLPGGLTIPM